MSGFYLLGLAAVWLFVSWIIYLIWRLLGFGSVGKPLWKAVHIFIGIVLFSAWFGSAFWMFVGKKIYYDDQVRRMCSKDGGIRVYEEIELPSDKYNRWGQINFFEPTKGENALGNEYVYMSDTEYLKKGNHFKLSITRHHAMVYRRSDKKLLGELVSYGRRGGDLPGFWNPSSYTCPDFKGDSLLERVFVKIENIGR